MIDFKRTRLEEKYHIIEVFECPIEVILFAASLGSENVTIENFRDDRNTSSIIISITSDNQIITPEIKQYEIDFQIIKTDFIAMKTVWHHNGCYAIFHNANNLKFKATNLKDIARYKALDNFNWTIEIAIPGSASDGWGQIASPDKTIIDKIENYIKGIH